MEREAGSLVEELAESFALSSWAGFISVGESNERREPNREREGVISSLCQATKEGQ